METILVTWGNKFPQETSILCVLSINVIVTIDDPSFETPFSGFHKVNAHSNFDLISHSHIPMLISICFDGEQKPNGNLYRWFYLINKI